uniref:Major facilitator superfamily (MFS) profile domain-containing protein n=1 Tax=Amphimedon queenslandica TaxID=400682 RepID=A0A1X7TFG9_AMPQE
TLVLTCLMHLVGHKYTIIFGLIVQAIQLFIYGVWTSKWLMWTAGVFATLSTIIYPAISALVSKNTKPEQQGILTAMRGLCNRLGPALFGLIFYLSHIHLKEVGSVSVAMAATSSNDIHGFGGASPVLINGTMSPTDISIHGGGLFRGLPFLFGVIPVLIALVVALCIKDTNSFIKKSS